MTSYVSQAILAEPAASYAQPMGMVFVIRCIPDMFTDERLNIGVCVIDSKGQRYAKVINEAGRLECLYGESAKTVVHMALVAKDAALAGHKSPSSQIVFDVPTPFYNTTPRDVLHSTFADQVTVALPHRDQNQPEMLDDTQALTQVTEAIKQKIGLDFELLANTPQVIIQTDKGARTMNIPLQPKKGVGTIRSAWYSAQTLKTHLMDSVLDLECAARYRNKTHMGLFILRNPNMDRRLADQIDTVIDNIVYRTPKAMHLEVSDDAYTLADHARDWAKTAV